MILRQVISAPIIYLQIVPIVFCDVMMEMYHRICFPLYGIPCVVRKNYIRIDRYKLSYLNWVEKINCAYCGYANGWFRYAGAIAAETEKYWCGITHQKYEGFKTPPYHKVFLPYGDKEAFDEYIKK